MTFKQKSQEGEGVSEDLKEVYVRRGGIRGKSLGQKCARHLSRAAKAQLGRVNKTIGDK